MKTLLFAVAAIAAVSGPAQADDIKVLASNGVRGALEELAPAFERASGHKVATTFGLAAALKRQIEAVLPDMLARGSGHIAAVASLAGYRPSASLPYGVSKAAVIYLMNGLRFEVAPRGLGVTVINPGFVKTPLTERNRFHMPFLLEASDAAEKRPSDHEWPRKSMLCWPSASRPPATKDATSTPAPRNRM